MSEIMGLLFKTLGALLGVVAVVVILNSVFQNNKTQTAISDLTQMVSATQALYSNQAAFTSLTATVAVNGNLAPVNMISGSTLTNPWGGVVTPAVFNTNSAEFQITQTLVPTSACAKLLAAISNIISGTVNGTALVVPVDAGGAVTACNSSPNTMVLVFGH